MGKEAPKPPLVVPSLKHAPGMYKGKIESRNIKAAATKGDQISKPKVPVTDRKVNKPPVSGSVSRYRCNMETAEERRAKLADWFASKGKTLKRPAMVTAAQSKTKVSVKPKAKPVMPKSQGCVVQLADAQPESRPAAHKQDSADALCADTQRAEATTPILTSTIMNTTLDLLENSDEDLFDSQQDRADEIVVNLCDAFEAMETLSRCSEVPQKTVCSEIKIAVRDADSDEEVTAVMPQREDASVVKYSVKTIPLLESMKKTIEGKVSTSLRRKINIKYVKFLTPVRRSTRCERQSVRLPAMLVDHDPCLKSLAELVNLDQDLNVLIYRKNPALLEDLPDQPRA